MLDKILPRIVEHHMTNLEYSHSGDLCVLFWCAKEEASLQEPTSVGSANSEIKTQHVLQKSSDAE